MKVLAQHHPFRIFAVSSLITAGALGASGYYLGLPAALIVLVLIVIEVTFSFDNAIINARVLMGMSRFWQQVFMTVGILIAVFGMRLVFPVVLVMATAGLSWTQVVDLALNRPEDYAREIQAAHTGIASFGGIFLLMLCLHFFLDRRRTVLWAVPLERRLQKIGGRWVYGLISLAVLTVITILPWNQHPAETFIAGVSGLATYTLIHGLAELFSRKQSKDTMSGTAQKAGMAGFAAFMYLEVLDASFSLDGVIGAFAVTQDVMLIAVGLGVGALWVRSLTIYMVRRQILGQYRFIEHGAHYTIGILAVFMLISLFIDLPEAVAGLGGIAIIGASVINSIQAKRKGEMHATGYQTAG